MFPCLSMCVCVCVCVFVFDNLTLHPSSASHILPIHTIKITESKDFQNLFH